MNLSLDRNSNEWQEWLRTIHNYFTYGEICPLLINKRNDNRPYIEIKILDMVFIGMLDSGANRSIINSKFANKLKSLGFESYTLHEGHVATADGVTHKLSEVFDVPVNFDNQFHVISLGEMDNSIHEIILGKDFFDIFGISLKFKNASYYLGNEVSCATTNTTAIICKEDLDESQQRELNGVIDEMKLAIGSGLGRTPLLKHTIDTGDNKPVRQKQYNFSPVIRQQIEQELEDMLEKDVVEPSYSAWCSPVLIVKKPNGENRLCLDSRQLNKVTKRDSYPLPRVSAIIDNLKNARYLSTIDLKSAFWQIPLDDNSKEKTAFAVNGRGLFQFKVMPFGLVNASQSQQRLMDILFQSHEDKIWAYLDDIIVCSETFEEHIKLLRQVTATLKRANLTINLSKCKFARSSLRYLGYIIDQDGLRTDPEKVSAILKFPRPKNVTELKRFIGLASWYRRFVKNFSLIAAPLHNLTKGNTKRTFVWPQEAEEAFISLKTLLTTTPVMSCPDYSKPFMIQCDASNEGIGAVLCQKTEDSEQAVAFLSRKLTDTEQRYSASERELLSVVYAIEKFRPYIDGVHFTVVTDHSALQWLHKMKDPHGRLARWAMKLQQFSFDIIHRPGKVHTVPDALSRATAELNIIEIEEKHKNDWYKTKVENLKSGRTLNDSDWEESNGLLYKRVFMKQYPNEENLWKLYIPESLRHDILRACHDNPRAGHLGIRKTQYRIKKHYFWPKIVQDVKQYVKNCEVCASHKVSQNLPFGQMGKHREVTAPWQVVSLDLMGPLPKSKKGNTMLFVITCWFSKLALLFPLRTAKADKICEILENQILLFGAPKAIISDNGKQFNSNAFKELATKYNCKLWFTPNYHPQSNPTERVNRVIGTMISAYIKHKKHNEWDVHLGEIGHAIRTAVHEATGHTPSYLFFGRETSVLDFGIRCNSEIGVLEEPLEIQVERFIRQLYERDKVYELVGGRLREAHDQSQKAYNLRRRPANFQVGETVWKRTKYLSNAGNKFMAKLAPKFEKAVIFDKISNNIYRLHNAQGKDVGTWHAKDLKSLRE